MKLGLIQINVGNDKSANLRKAETLINQIVAKERPRWVALPEMFDFAGDGRAKSESAEILSEGAAYRMAQALAKKHSVYLHAGSFHEWRPDQERISNTSVVFNPQGEQVALYRKLHLFDIVTPSGVVYRESGQIVAGDEIVAYEAEG